MKSLVQYHLAAQLRGFSYEGACKLRNAERALRRWYTDYANGVVRPTSDDDGPWERCYGDPSRANAVWYCCKDGETKVVAALDKLLASHPDYGYRLQRDPRGCALYLVYVGDALAKPFDLCCSA